MIASPVIDAINDTTFHYQSVSPDLYGTFNWGLHFEWHQRNSELREAEQKARQEKEMKGKGQVARSFIMEAGIPIFCIY